VHDDVFGDAPIGRLGRDLHRVKTVHDLTARGIDLSVLTGQGAAIDTPPAAEYDLRTVVAGGERAAATLPEGGFVVLDVAPVDARRAEGFAREVVRAVQDARKATGRHVTDRIRLVLGVPPVWAPAVAEHRDLIARETLATDLVVGETDDLTVVVERTYAGAAK
jgi:isoleucyl-tRNA synthetase